MINIYDLGSEEYKNGAVAALKNAKSHLNVADKSAEINEYGIATSHLIFAVEELSKACMLQMKALNNSVEIKNLHLYFRRHDVKHNAIFKLIGTAYSSTLGDIIFDKVNKIKMSKNELIFTLFIIVIIGIAIWYFNSQDKSKPVQLDKNNSNESNQSTLEEFKKTLEKKIPEVVEKKFINEKTLEELRRAGLYVDFDDKNKTWLVPKDNFKKEEYEKFHEFTHYSFTLLESFLFDDNINSKNIADFISKLDIEKIIIDTSTKKQK